MADNNIQIKLSLVEDVNKGLADAQKGIEKFASAAVASHRKISEGVDSISTQMERYKNLYLGLFQALPRAAAGIQSLGQMAESWKMVNARLTNATEGQVDFANAQARVIAIATQTGQSLDAVAGLYGKLRTNAGLAAEDAGRLTAILAKATQLDGGGQGAAAALTQLQQGLASGTLRGEELNSVLEQTPTLALSIARGLGMTTGQLREYAKEGKLTAETVKQALFDQEAAISRQFANLPVTIGRALENVRTAAIQELGQIDAAIGGTSGIASGVQALAENFRTVVAVSGVAATAVTGAWLQSIATRAAAEQAAHINSLRLIAERKAAELAAAKASLATSSIGLTGPALIAARQNVAALAAQSVAAGSALQAAGRQASVFSAAFAGIGRAATLLTGPVGLAVTAIGTIAGAIYAARDSVIDLEATQATVWETLRAGWQLLADGVVGSLSSIADAVGLSGIEWQSLFASAFDGILSFARNFVNGIVGTFVGIGDAIGKTGGFIYESFRIAFDAVGDLVVALGRDVQAAMSGNFDMSNMKAALSRGLEGAKANWQNYADSIGESMQKALGTDYVGAALSKVKRTLAEQVRETRNALADADAEKWLNGIADGAANAGKASVASGAAAKKAASDYDRLISSIRDKIAVEQAATQSQEKLTEGQKLAAKFVADIAANQIKLTDAQKQSATAALEDLILLEKGNDVRERAAKAQEASQKAREQAAQAAQKEAQSLAEQVARAREENEQIGLTVEQLDALKLARIDATIATKEQALATLEAGTASAAEVQATLRQIDALNELRSITASSQVKTANKKAIDEQSKEWQRGWEETDRLAREVFSTWGKDGANVAQKIGDTLKSALLSAIYEATLKPVVFQVYGTVAGALGMGGGGGSATGTLNSASNLFSLGKTGMNLLNTGNVFDPLIYSSMGSTLGLSGTGVISGASTLGALSLAGSGGASTVGAMSVANSFGGAMSVPTALAPTATATAAGTALSSLAAAVPYIAAAAAVISLLGDNEPDTVRGKLAVRTTSGDFEDGAQLGSRYGYVGFNDGDTENFSGKAAQAASKGLIDTLDLLTAAFGGTDATAQKLATSIQAIDFGSLDGTYTTEDWLKNYTGNIGKGLVTALRDANLEGQVGQAFASLSDAAIAGLTDPQITSLIAATTTGIMGLVLDLVDETAIGVEGVVSAIDKITTNLPVLQQQFGVTADVIGTAFLEGIRNAESAQQAGEMFAGMVTNSIYDSLEGQYASSITSTVMNEIINPMLAAMALGQSAAQALSTAAVQDAINTAQQMASAYTALLESPEFKSVMDGLQGALSGIGSAGYVARPERYTYTPTAVADVARPDIGGSSSAAQADEFDTLSWQQRLDVLQGKSTDRQISLFNDLATATGETDKALISLVYSLEDAAAIAEEAAGLQQQIWQLEGNTTAIRNAELAALDPANRALQEYIYTLTDAKDAAKAADDAQKLLTGKVDDARTALLAGYDKEVSALESTRDQFDGFAKSLKSFRDGLLVGNLSTLSPEQKYFELQGRFTDISRRAQLGDVAAIESLQQVSQDFLDASQGYYASSPQYALDFQAVLAATEGTESLATRQAKIAQEQLDTWRGYGVQFGLIEEHTKTLTELFQAWVAASNTAGQAIPGLTQQSIIGPGVVPISTPSDSMMGVFRDNYLSGFVSDAMTGPDAMMAAAAAAKANGFTADQIAAKWNDMTGEQVSATDLTAWAKENKIPGYAVGANYIPRDQLALVHRGEQIKPAAYVEQDRKERNETNALLRQLLAELQADKAQRGAIGTETIAKLEALVDTGAAQKRELARAA
jgi:tape measure domain-containing protein